MITETSSDLLFHSDAGLAVAKAAAHLADSALLAEGGCLTSASVAAYYGLFHLGLAVMWIVPGSLDDRLRDDLERIRREGAGLPDKTISHDKMRGYLTAVFKAQSGVDLGALGSLFCSAKELREFVQYGPRVTYEGGQSYVGPCHLTHSIARRLINDANDSFVATLTTIHPLCTYKGAAWGFAMGSAPRLLSDTQFPFVGWYTEATLVRAKLMIESVKEMVSKKAS